MKKLTIIRTEKSSKKLSELVKKLNQRATYAPGVDVKEDNKVKGKYQIMYHDGMQDLEGFLLRLVKKDIIIQPKGQSVIESLLRANKIPFSEYENIEMENPDGKINYSLQERKPDLIYQPQS